MYILSNKFLLDYCKLVFIALLKGAGFDGFLQRLSFRGLCLKGEVMALPGSSSSVTLSREKNEMKTKLIIHVILVCFSLCCIVHFIFL